MSSLDQLPKPDNDRKVRVEIKHKDYSAIGWWPQWSAAATVVASVTVITAAVLTYFLLV